MESGNKVAKRVATFCRSRKITKIAYASYGKNPDGKSQLKNNTARMVRFLQYRAELGIAVLLLFSTLYFNSPVEYDNTSSRYFLLSAVVDYGQFNIDIYKDQTIDTSSSDEHTYSNKAIGTPLVAAPIYWILRNLTPIQHDMPLSDRARYICRALTTSLPYAVLGIILFRTLLGLGAAPVKAFWTVIAYAFGTISWIHASLFSGHQMAGTFAFLSFAWIRMLRSKPSNIVRWFLA